MVGRRSVFGYWSNLMLHGLAIAMLLRMKEWFLCPGGEMTFAVVAFEAKQEITASKMTRDCLLLINAFTELNSHYIRGKNLLPNKLPFLGWFMLPTYFSVGCCTQSFLPHPLTMLILLWVLYNFFFWTPTFLSWLEWAIVPELLKEMTSSAPTLGRSLHWGFPCSGPLVAKASHAGPAAFGRQLVNPGNRLTLVLCWLPALIFYLGTIPYTDCVWTQRQVGDVVITQWCSFFFSAMDNLQERALHIRKVLLNLPKTTLIVMRYLFAFLNQWVPAAEPAFISLQSEQWFKVQMSLDDSCICLPELLSLADTPPDVNAISKELQQWKWITLLAN